MLTHFWKVPDKHDYERNDHYENEQFDPCWNGHRMPLHVLKNTVWYRSVAKVAQARPGHIDCDGMTTAAAAVSKQHDSPFERAE